MSDVLQVFLLALLSMFNPALLAAVTVMMLLESPKRLMLGYLLGAYLTSIGLGLTIVFALQGSSAVSTSQSTISPAGDIVLGMLALLIAFVLATDRDRGLRKRKERRKRERQGEGDDDEKESLPLRLLGRGSPRVAFAVGIVLSFPGASYLAGLGHIDSLGTSTVATALLVVGFCLVQLTLLELPLIGYALAPDWTQGAVNRFRAWLARSGRSAAIIGAAAIGSAAVVKGIAGLLA
jgi:Sap, sulfolipid-1-addressing protein